MPFAPRRALAATLSLLCVIALLVLPGGSAGGESSTARRSPGLAADLASLDPSTRYGFFAHFSAGDPAAWVQTLTERGAEVARVYDRVGAVFAVATLEVIASLGGAEGITYLERNEAIEFFGDTAVWATRARVAQVPVAGGPYRDGSGRVLDGTGVGVAVIDSGVDAGHPDLAPRIVRNYKVAPCVLVYTATERCFPDTVMADVGGVPSDTSSGHGTHVAGIIAGTGAASEGTFKGVAAGSSLFVYGVGEGRNLFSVTDAYWHIVTTQQSPTVRVINNSWGDSAGSVYDANGIFSKLVAEATALGITSVFAAGNDGSDADDGSGDDLSSYAKDPTPGVITVANYDDGESGNRDHTLDTSSSRGLAGQPADYPDISAPGSLITSTCSPRLPLCQLGPELGWQPYYALMSGTSMASPHIAGIAALLYQAQPSLTPAQVEDVLQDTARKFTGLAGAPGGYEPDPQNPGGTISYDKGAGLADVPAALDALGVAKGGLPTPPVPTVSISAPTAGASVGDLVAVTGSATDGTPASAASALVTADGGDYPGFGAADIVGLSATELASGMSYSIQVRDVEDVGLTSVGLRVTQNVDGRAFLTSVNVTRTGAAPAAAGTSNTAIATSVSRDVATDTVTFFVPFTSLGNPAAAAPVHNLFASSFVGVVSDVAPGGPGAEVLVKPRYADPFTVLTVDRPGSIGVFLSVDSGPEVPATLSGASPTFGYAGSLDLSTLCEGTHTVNAVLRLDGVAAATSAVPVVLERPQGGPKLTAWPKNRQCKA